jgi:glyceraldehyde-3-phosphate dehydrogenase/erythrose-4-phosphate dehydrogenase
LYLLIKKEANKMASNKGIINRIRNTTVLINGAGTVGNRAADILHSLGFQVLLGKYGAGYIDKDDKSKGVDIKTQEILELQARIKSKLTMYAARGRKLEERLSRMKKVGFDAKGGIDALDFSKVALTIDATDGREERNFIELYKPNNAPFAINGGGLDRLVSGLFFAGVPETTATEPSNDSVYHNSNAKIVSCNTHCITTGLGLLRKVLLEEQPDSVSHISVLFARRSYDPNTNGRPSSFVSMKSKDYHMDEVEFLLPQVKGKIHTTVSKWPTEYFHNLVMDIDFNKNISSQVVEGYKLALQVYPRAILAEDELCHKKTIVAAAKAKIIDGDIPFPVYMVEQIHERKLRICALTPQRAIVAPSTADYVVMRTQGVNWQEASEFVNKNATFRGHSFSHIANSVQDNLRNYDRIAGREQELLNKYVRRFQTDMKLN